MSNERKVICPKCEKQIATYTGTGSIDVLVRCPYCNRGVHYRAIIPAKPSEMTAASRTSASGCRFD